MELCKKFYMQMTKTMSKTMIELDLKTIKGFWHLRSHNYVERLEQNAHKNPQNSNKSINSQEHSSLFEIATI